MYARSYRESYRKIVLADTSRRVLSDFNSANGTWSSRARIVAMYC